LVNFAALIARVWTTPKPDAESGKENEDRFSLSGYQPDSQFENDIKAAVADGASGSLFSREWARELTRAYCQQGAHSSEAPLWETAAQHWKQGVRGKNLPWYLEARASEGAQAAFLGLTWAKDGTWEAIAAGDCCLFQRQGNRVRSIFPLARSEDFSAHPALWATNAGGEQNRAATRRTSGYWSPGDNFYLMTDAIAFWCLREIEEKRDPWIWLDTIGSEKDFRQRVEILRESGRLKGDDTTILHLRFADREKESTKDGALADTP
jgi:hypothetical protein